MDEALGKGHGHGEALAGRQGGCGREARRVVVLARGEVASLGPGRAGVGGELLHRGPGRQAHEGRGPLDRQPPAVAGHVPVEFVVARELSDLAVRPVGQGVGVSARRQERVLAPHVDHLAVAGVLDPVCFLVPVAAHGQDAKSDRDAAPVRGFVSGGKLPHEAVADGFAGRQHGDGFGHGQAGVRVDVHHAVKGQDAFALRRPCRDNRNQEQQEGGQRRPDPAAAPVHEPAPPSKRTLGASRSAGFSISKEGAAVKPKLPATRLAGKDWTRVLKSRTAPL